MSFWPRLVTYMVYPPEGSNANPYEHRTISRARRKAKVFGPGATIVRWRKNLGLEDTDMEWQWDGERFHKFRLEHRAANLREAS